MLRSACLVQKRGMKGKDIHGYRIKKIGVFMALVAEAGTIFRTHRILLSHRKELNLISLCCFFGFLLRFLFLGRIAKIF